MPHHRHSRSRATFSGAFCALTLAVTSGVHAADVTLNLGWATPLDSDNGVIASKFEELVEQYSEGTIDVKLRCCAQIATEDDAFKAQHFCFLLTLPG